MKTENHLSIYGPNASDGNSLSRFQVMCISHGFQSNYERGFCNGLSACGAEVTLISSDRTDVRGLNSAVRTVNLRGSQEEKRPAWIKALNLLRYHVQLLSYILWRRPPVVHVMGLLDPPMLLGVVEGLWCRAFGGRYVLTVHNLLPHDRHSDFNRFAYGWSFRIPHHLVAHTAKMKDDLVREFGLAPERITVMEHGVEPAAKSMDWNDSRSDDAIPIILAFGKIAPYKGVDLLVDALRTAQFPFLLIIAGVCSDADFRKKLKAAIDIHPFKSRIEWVDRFVVESEMEKLFKSADLLALPYRHIDQSGVLFQALRFGVPVLATRVGQFAEYITDEIGELAQPGNVVDLSVALERWAARQSTFSREYIREFGKKFEWSSTILALKEAYRRDSPREKVPAD